MASSRLDYRAVRAKVRGRIAILQGPTVSLYVGLIYSGRA